MVDSLRICRCCLSNGCYKDIANEYYFSGLKEVYAELLLNTFNVTISSKKGIGPSAESRLICEVCIQRLREAADFKRQVLDAERNIDLLLRQLPGDKSPPVACTDFGDDKSLEKFSVINNPDEVVNAVSDLNDDLDLKEEIYDDPVDRLDDKQEQLLVIKLIKKEAEVPKILKKIKSKKTRKQITNTSEDNKIREKKPRFSNEIKPKTLQDRKLRENTIKLILNSNVCIFKSLKVKFQCGCCDDKFIYMKELREHWEKEHCDEKQIRKLLKRGSNYKNAEVTNLFCKLCEQPSKDIITLQAHLAASHGVTFEVEGNLLVPYSVVKENRCAVCDVEFNSFLRLHMHMNSHFTNHVCERCGAGFVRRAALRLHARFMHRATRCGQCAAAFSTQADKCRHVAKVHGRAPKSLVKCIVCEKTFKYFYQLFQHKVEAHGGARRAGHCADCNKSFISPANLRIHIRSVHLRERNYTCSTCPSRFFTRSDQRRHERTHAAAPALPCALCAAQLRSRDSWTRHMRRQHPGANIKR